MKKLILVAGLLALPLTANAVVISIHISGIIDWISSGDPKVFGDIGDPFTATVSFDTDLVPPYDPKNNDGANYYDPHSKTDFLFGDLPKPFPSYGSGWYSNDEITAVNAFHMTDVFGVSDVDGWNNFDESGTRTDTRQSLQIFFDDPTQTLLSTPIIDDAFALDFSSLTSPPRVSASVTTTTFDANGAFVSAVISGIGVSVQEFSVSVGVVPVTITASRASAPLGEPVTLEWKGPAASSCVATGGESGDGWEGNLPTSGTRSVTESGAGNYIYTVTCTLGSQTTTANVTVARIGPTATLSANPTFVTTGQPITLRWSSTNSTGCTGGEGRSGDGWAGPKAPSGTTRVTESVPGRVTYTLTCGSGLQTAFVLTQVTVNSRTPTATISASPTKLKAGDPMTLTWRSTNASSCVASESGSGSLWSGATPLSGHATVTEPVEGSVTYTITCTNDGLSVQASVGVSYQAATSHGGPASVRELLRKWVVQCIRWLSFNHRD